MTPMIDVVFLLIIFFLVSSHLARVENRLPLDLPNATTFRQKAAEQSALTISVNEDAQVLVSGKRMADGDLRAVLADLRMKDGPMASIRIRTDKSVQYQYVEPVLKIAADVGLTDISIAVKEVSK